MPAVGEQINVVVSILDPCTNNYTTATRVTVVGDTITITHTNGCDPTVFFTTILGNTNPIPLPPLAAGTYNVRLIRVSAAGPVLFDQIMNQPLIVRASGLDSTAAPVPTLEAYGLLALAGMVFGIVALRRARRIDGS